MTSYYPDADEASYTRVTRRKAARSRRGRRRRRRHPFRRLLLFLLLAAFIIVGYSRFVEPYILTTAYAEYTAPRITCASADAGGEPLKIAIFADTHFSDYYTPENFEDVISRINAAEPDVVFFLGDLVDDYNSYSGSLENIADGLARIEASIGKYAVYGNHDYGGGMQFHYPDIMEAGGFELLINQTAVLEELNICILGIDDMLIGYGDPAAAESLSPDSCNIVICHEPDVYDMIADCDTDLMLAGHTHGRQINLKIFDDLIQPALGKKYIKGSYSFGNARGSELYVTAGIGMTKLPMRFASPPEINIITLAA